MRCLACRRDLRRLWLWLKVVTVQSSLLSARSCDCLLACCRARGSSCISRVFFFSVCICVHRQSQNPGLQTTSSVVAAAVVATQAPGLKSIDGVETGGKKGEQAARFLGRRESKSPAAQGRTGNELRKIAAGRGGRDGASPPVLVPQVSTRVSRPDGRLVREAIGHGRAPPLYPRGSQHRCAKRGALKKRAMVPWCPVHTVRVRTTSYLSARLSLSTCRPVPVPVPAPARKTDKTCDTVATTG